MRVALVGDYPLEPNVIKNGPQAVFTYLLEGLRRVADLDLHVVTGKYELETPRSFKEDNVTFHYLPYPRLPAELSFFILRRHVHRTLHAIQPELVHGQSSHRYGAMCLSSGYRSILTSHNVHGAEVPFTAGRINQLRLWFHFAVSRRYFVSHVRHILSISPYIRSSYEGQVNAAFYDIDNPISDAFFDLDPGSEILNQVLFVGMLRTRKRPDLALAALALAVKEVPELCLAFAGAPVEKQLWEQMQTFIADHRLEQNVRFMGHLDEPQLVELYQNCSIFLLTSDLETSPMVVEQALAAGKPVVVTDAGGTRYLVEDGCNGFVIQRNDAQGLANALIKLAQNDDLRKRFRIRAREAALQRFKADVVAAQVRDTYDHVLK